MGSCARRFPLSNDSGQVLVLTVLCIPVLLGITALSIDASFMYDARNRLFAAADAAAKSGAIEVHRNPALAQPSLQNFANQQVVAHGFNPAATTSVVVRRCDDPSATCSAPHAGNAAYVEAIVSEPTDTFFGRILGFYSMTPRARAVAGTGPGPNCLITLAPPGAVPPSTSIGNSVINMPGCSVANAGHLVTTNPNADINALSNGVTGVCTGAGCSNMSGMQIGVPPPLDPLAGLPAPSNPGGCIAVTNPTTPLTAGCYSRISANTTLNFGPGTYYVTGPILIGNNVTVRSTGGIMIYLAGAAPTGPCTAAATAGCIDVRNHADFLLTAQTSGPYEGILFFQDPANHLDASFDGNNPLYNLSGVMYFPGADVSFRNGINAVNDCMLFVARSLHMNNGNGSFSNTCSSYGGSPILTVSVAE